MKIKALAAALCLITAPVVSANVELVQETRQEAKVQQQHNAQREQGFKMTEKEFTTQRDALLKQRQQLQTETDTLSDTFSKNENDLARLEEQLRLETGSLGELFGVVRQAAKDLDSEMAFSVTGVDRTEYRQVIDSIVEARTLPSLEELTGLWKGLEDQISASVKCAPFLYLSLMVRAITPM